GGMAGEMQAFGVATVLRRMAVQPGEPGTNLPDDGVHAHGGREVVADQRDRGALLQKRPRDEREVLAIAALPVAAVDEHEKRRARAVRQEQIERLARRRPVGEVEAARPARAQRGALGLVAREVREMLRLRGAQIVLRVKSGPLRLALA